MAIPSGEAILFALERVGAGALDRIQRITVVTFFDPESTFSLASLAGALLLAAAVVAIGR